MSSAKSWQKYLTKITHMSRDEIRTRGGQELAKRWDAVVYGLGINIGTNIPARIKDATTHFFFDPSDVPDILALIRERLPHEAELIVEEAERVCRHRFALLGYSDLDYGQEIDWQLDVVHGRHAPSQRWYKIRYLEFNQVGDHKIIWELNRHQHLMTLAKAYRFTHEDRFVEELLRQWYHWQETNPYPTGINWASSLEVAFRSLSWIWAQHLLSGSSATLDRFNLDLLGALRLSGRHISRYLSTYFSPNTHLLGEAVALFFIGTLYPQIPESRLWQQSGWEIILREAGRQVRPDGLYFEPSIYYHVYALDFLLHARLLASRNKIPIPPPFDQKIEKMLEVLSVLGQHGSPPRFGDDDGGRLFNPRRNLAEHMLDPLSTGAAIFGRPGFKATAGGLREESIWLLGRRGVEKFDSINSSVMPSASAHFDSGGIYVMAGSESLPRRLVIAAGAEKSVASGHAHADALSVQLTVNGHDWLVDSGAFCYVGERGEREWFRGSLAHNTLQVDGLDQSEMAGPFGWRSPVNVRVNHWVEGKSFDLFAGRHTGYCRLAQPVIHERWVFSLKDRFWLVRDLALGEGEHRVDIGWHLAPEFSPRCTGESPAVQWTRGNEGLALLPAEGHGWAQQVTQGKVSQVYGKQEPSHVLNFRTEGRLPLEFGVLALPMEKRASPLGVLKRMDDGTADPIVRAYRYTRLDESHLFCFAKSGQRWDLNSWSSDAYFVYCGTAGDGRQHWVLCGGSYVEVNGHRVLECKAPVERFEWWYTGAGEEISCSDTSALNQTVLQGQGIGEVGGREK